MESRIKKDIGNKVEWSHISLTWVVRLLSQWTLVQPNLASVHRVLR